MRSQLKNHPLNVDSQVSAPLLDHSDSSAPLNPHEEQLREAMRHEHQAVLLPLLFISDLREWELHH